MVGTSALCDTAAVNSVNMRRAGLRCSHDLTSIAQDVQVSAFPNHYAKHEQMAGDIIKTALNS
jgi:hypothetical protein